MIASHILLRVESMEIGLKLFLPVFVSGSKLGRDGAKYGGLLYTLVGGTVSR